MPASRTERRRTARGRARPERRAAPARAGGTARHRRPRRRPAPGVSVSMPRRCAGPGDRWLSRTVSSWPTRSRSARSAASEHAAVGEATARAYREFWTPDSPGWEPYLARIADVGSRAERAIVLVAVDEGVIAGSVTLELDSRIGPGAERATRTGRGASPHARGRARNIADAGSPAASMLACIDVARAPRQARADAGDRPGHDRRRSSCTSSSASRRPAERRRPDGPVLLGYALDIDSQAAATR